MSFKPKLRFPPWWDAIDKKDMLWRTLPSLLPLASTLGRNFEYEYSLFVSILSLILLPLSVLFSRPQTWGKSLLTSIMLSGLWGCLAFITQSCLCSFPGFCFWMLINVAPTLLLCTLWQELLIRGKQQSYRRLTLLGFHGIFLLCILLHLVAILWFFPQKRVLHWAIGFIHGPIYDEWIAVDSGMLWLRAAHGLLFLSLLLWISAHKRFAALALLSMLLCQQYSQPYLSTHTGVQALNQVLPQTYVGNSFILHHQQQVPSEYSERLQQEITFHMQELTQILELGTLPKPVHIYVYPDDQTKKLAFGGASTDITDIYTPSVHITENRSWLHDSLRHELVHALSSFFAFHGLGFHPNLALTEGFAEALAPEDNLLSIDAASASLINQAMIEDLHSLFSLSFWKESQKKAYSISGSLLRYLIETYKISKVKEIYNGKDLSQVIAHQELSSLLQNWQKHISHKHTVETVHLYTQDYFRSPAIFSEACPHSKVDLSPKYSDTEFIAWRRPWGWDADRDYASWRKDLGDVGGSTKLDEIKQKIQDCDQLRFQDPKKSDEILQDLLDIQQKHFLGQTTREILARQLIESSLNGTRVLEWRSYLAHKGELPPILPQEALIESYLRLKNSQAISSMSVVRVTELLELDIGSLPKELRSQWHRSIARELTMRREYKAAHRAWGQAIQSSPEGSKELFAQNQRFVQFVLNH